MGRKQAASLVIIVEETSILRFHFGVGERPAAGLVPLLSSYTLSFLIAESTVAQITQKYCLQSTHVGGDDLPKARI
jgi:hypothetical protein